MSRPSKINNKEVTYLKNRYQLEINRPKDIYEELGFDNDDDVEICKSIITQLEAKAAQVLREGKTVALPYIGRLRKPLVKQEYSKNRRLLKLARNVMNTQDYKDYRKDLYKECVDKVSKNDELAKIRRRLVALNRKMYNKKCITFGEEHARIWIESLLWVQGIEFNQEVQDVFDEIEEHENNNRKINNRR